MVDVSIACLVDHTHKTRHFDPKKFKAKGLGLLWAIIICKKKGAMVG
jgi:hypothetical protein